MMVLPLAVALATAVLVFGGSAADAAFTTDKCLVQKRQAWTALRKCEGGEDVKRLKGKTPSFAGCRTRFDEKLVKIDAKAEKAAITCRFGANGDGTITDYDTALMWEAKDGEVGGVCLILPGAVSHCVNLEFSLDAAVQYVHRANESGADRSFLAGYTDWRLPTFRELEGIEDPTAPGCAAGTGACIDPIFGPTLIGFHWTSSKSQSGATFVVNSYGGPSIPPTLFTVRAVRDAF